MRKITLALTAILTAGCVFNTTYEEETTVTDNSYVEVDGRKNFGSAHALMTLPQPCVVISTWDKEHHPNVMVAAWAGQIDATQIVISLSQHKTSENLEESKAFTLSFVDQNTLVQSDYFGLVSGKLVSDKLSHVGFTTTPSPNVNAPIINEYPLTLECKVNSFKDGILIGEVVNMSADERILTDGKIDLGKLQPVVFDPAANCYRAVGEVLGHAWDTGKVYMAQ